MTLAEEEVQVVSVVEPLPTDSPLPALKPLFHEVDPQHYRQLVKGLIPLRSSIMKANLDPSPSDSDVQNRKSVHFSDQQGYTLSMVRSYDKPVRTLTYYVSLTLTSAR